MNLEEFCNSQKQISPLMELCIEIYYGQEDYLIYFQIYLLVNSTDDLRAVTDYINQHSLVPERIARRLGNTFLSKHIF